MIDKIGWKFLKAAILLMTLMICSMPSLAQVTIRVTDVKYDYRDPNPEEDERALQKRVQAIMDSSLDAYAKYAIITRSKSTADFNQILKDSLTYLFNKSEDVLRVAEQCQEISNNQLGQKLTDENREFIQNIIDFLDENTNWQIKYAQGGDPLERNNNIDALFDREADKWWSLFFQRKFNNQILEGIKKDYSKNKINKNLKEPLDRLCINLRYNNRYSNLYSTISKRYDGGADGEALFSQYWPETYVALNKTQAVTYYDTIPNPKSRRAAFASSKVDESGSALRKFINNDFALLRKGYEWVFKDKLQFVRKSYPEKVAYLVSESHPGSYIVSNYSSGIYIQDVDRLYGDNVFIFDENGRLMKVINISAEVNRQDMSRDRRRGKQIAIAAYKENKYDIKSADKEANDYITSQLNLRELTAAEKKIRDKSADLFAEGFKKSMTADAKHGTNSKRAKAEKNEGDLLMMAALFGGSNVSDKGARWLSQIEEDYWPYFEKFYKIERVDDVTIRVIYVDPKSIEPAYEMIYTYVTGDRPFTAKETISVNKITNK